MWWKFKVLVQIFLFFKYENLRRKFEFSSRTTGIQMFVLKVRKFSAEIQMLVLKLQKPALEIQMLVLKFGICWRKFKM